MVALCAQSGVGVVKPNGSGHTYIPAPPPLSLAARARRGKSPSSLLSPSSSSPPSLPPSLASANTMTYGVHNIIGVLRVSAGGSAPERLGSSVTGWLPKKLLTYLFLCHYGHALEFVVALAFYLLVWPATFPHAGTWALPWVAKVVAFNLACEACFYGFWHFMMYSGAHVSPSLKEHKLNPEEQYNDSEGTLSREVLFTTLGWLQSSAFQCVMMHLWASGRVPYIATFFGSMQHTLFNLASVAFVTYWREFHFYWVHRMMHDWFPFKDGEDPTAAIDPGRWLYQAVHSLHHKSHNPGPFSGLSMHPIEHLFYYSCTLLPLLLPLHPMHFLYAKFHADIAPVGGHDGYAYPGGGGDHHYLHHAKLNANYGVPLVDFDWLFGSWVDYQAYKDAGGKSLDKGRELTYERFGWLGERTKSA
jgi:sterol desaturase/sphingolipid hydroxylase (fatty acid hydroxylase superfamily)